MAKDFVGPLLWSPCAPLVRIGSADVGNNLLSNVAWVCAQVGDQTGIPPAMQLVGCAGDRDKHFVAAAVIVVCRMQGLVNVSHQMDHPLERLGANAAREDFGLPCA